MQVLVFTSDSEYKWKTVKDICDDNVKTKDGARYCWLNVLDVKNDIRSTRPYKCRNCGKRFKTMDDFTKHVEKEKASADCAKCPYANYRDDMLISEKIKANADGTYTKIRKTVCKLDCNLSWSTRGRSISEVKERNMCKYYKCNEGTLRKETPFKPLSKKMLTIQALSDKWKLCEMENTYRYKRSCLYAHHNAVGVIDMFIIMKRGDYEYVKYANKKLYKYRYGWQEVPLSCYGATTQEGVEDIERMMKL